MENKSIIDVMEKMERIMTSCRNRSSACLVLRDSLYEIVYIYGVTFIRRDINMTILVKTLVHFHFNKFYLLDFYSMVDPPILKGHM